MPQVYIGPTYSTEFLEEITTMVFNTYITILAIAMTIASTNGSPLFGDWMKGISNFNTDAGKKLADYVNTAIEFGTGVGKDGASLGTNIGKEAITGGGGVVKNVLNTTADVSKNTLNAIGSIGDRLGVLGKPINTIKDIGLKGVETGANSAKNAVDRVESVGTKTMDGVDKLGSFTMDTVDNSGKLGVAITKNTLDALNEGAQVLFS